MTYFVVRLPMKDNDKSRDFRAQHLSFLKELRGSGKVVANGKFADGSGGMVIYRVASIEECKALVTKDPYVVEGARGFEIVEWEAVWANNVD